MDSQLFNHLDQLFITKNDLRNNFSKEFSNKSIVITKTLGLWGTNGLIVDYDEQEILWDLYDQEKLMMISHLLANYLIIILLQWVGSHHPIYYYPHKQYFHGCCYYQYSWPLKKKAKLFWKRHGHPYALKIGQKIHQGVLGSFFWQYNESRQPISQSLQQISL
jgi:hypothetical protein